MHVIVHLLELIECTTQSEPCNVNYGPSFIIMCQHWLVSITNVPEKCKILKGWEKYVDVGPVCADREEARSCLCVHSLPCCPFPKLLI